VVLDRLGKVPRQIRVTIFLRKSETVETGDIKDRMQGVGKRKREREEERLNSCAGPDASSEAAASSARADAIRSADRTNQGDFAWRKSGALPCDVWQAFGLAQRGDRVGLVSTPSHRGVTAIIKEVHLNSHWPSKLCVVLERCGEELDDILRSEVVLLSASRSALGPGELIIPGCGKLGRPKEDLLGERLGEGAETQLAMKDLEPPCAEVNLRCRNSETSTVSLRVALWIIILANNDPNSRIAPAFQQSSLALLMMKLHDSHTDSSCAGRLEASGSSRWRDVDGGECEGKAQGTRCEGSRSSAKFRTAGV
jgi:hypothetical protein